MSFCCCKAEICCILAPDKAQYLSDPKLTSDIKTDLLMEDVKLQDVDNIWADVQGTTRLGLLGDAAQDLKMLVSLESQRPEEGVEEGIEKNN